MEGFRALITDPGDIFFHIRFNFSLADSGEGKTWEIIYLKITNNSS